MSSTQRFVIFADYFQFILMDESSEDDFSTIWTGEALNRNLAVGCSAICPGTLRNAEVDVEIHLSEREPQINLKNYDHAVESSFEIPSGKLIVMSCTGYVPDAPCIEVTPGTYRALFLASGIETIKAEWEPANDLYTVYLWPGEKCEPKLLKHWQRNNA